MIAEYPRTESIVRMGEHNRGLAMSGLPPLKLDGYCTNPFNLHRTGVQVRFLFTHESLWLQNTL